MTDATTARNKVFISYSHEDADWLKCVRTHLRPLERALHLDIHVWDDSEIRAGDNWPQQIADAIASARVIVLLVSPRFLESEYIATEEIPRLEAAQRDGATILPLIISHSRFAKTPGLSHLQTINDPETPLISMTQGEQDKVFVKLADAVEHAFTRPQLPRPEPSADAARKSRDITRAAKDEKLNETINLLTHMRNNLPMGRLEISDMDEYHALLDSAQNESGCDLSDYRIPKTAIKSIEIPLTHSYDMFGQRYGDPYRIERFIPSHALRSKLDALLNFFDEKRS